eukprot:181694_1
MRTFLFVVFGVLLCEAVLGGGSEKAVKEEKTDFGGFLSDFSKSVDDFLQTSTKLISSFDHYTFHHFPSPAAAPKYEIVDNEKKFEVTYKNLGGYEMDDIEIKLEPNHVLRLHGQRKKEDEEGFKSSADFNHIFKLSQYADIDNIAAEMTSGGKLTVVVPKLDTPKPLRTTIPIQRLDTKATK